MENVAPLRKPENCAGLNRREFLLTGTAALATSILWLTLPGTAAGLPMRVAGYPRSKIGSLAGLKAGVPQYFDYPFDGDSCALIKLGAYAGGGVGPNHDIVAFNTWCTHMGGPLADTYNHAHKVFGPCPFHLTTFDLTRHGIVAAGHATESLPQVILEVEGGDVYATALMGLLYGRHENLQARDDRSL